MAIRPIEEAAIGGAASGTIIVRTLPSRTGFIFAAMVIVAVFAFD